MAYICKFYYDSDEKYFEYMNYAYKECVQWKGEDHKKSKRIKELCEFNDDYNDWKTWRK